jgi:hypothetical protein
MEEYDGIATLATHLRQNVDVAFMHRVDFSAPCPFPEEAAADASERASDRMQHRWIEPLISAC